MSQERSPFDSPTACAVLDTFYADLDHEPDWAAIRARLMQTHEPLYSVCVDILKIVWCVYEDSEAGQAKLFAVKHGL